MPDLLLQDRENSAKKGLEQLIKQMNIEKQIQNIKEQFEGIESLFEKHDRSEEKISEWSISYHLEHILTAHISILAKILENYSLESESDQGRTLLGHLVLTTRKIPRGKGQAPDNTIPKNKSLAEIKQLYQEFKELLSTVEERSEEISNSKFKFEHPYFGNLNIKDWINFIQIHNGHHLSIAKEIAAGR